MPFRSGRNHDRAHGGRPTPRVWPRRPPFASWRTDETFHETTSPTEQLKNAAIEAAISALRDSTDEPKRRSALSGSRALAAGLVLYAAGFAAFKGRSLLLEQLSSNRAEEEEEAQTREEEEDPEAEEYEQEPQADEEDDQLTTGARRKAAVIG